VNMLMSSKERKANEISPESSLMIILTRGFVVTVFP
jgi:hypothetical protein